MKFRLLCEQSDGSRRVVAEDLLGIAVLVPNAVAKDETQIAFAERRHRVAGLEYANDAGIANHDSRFASLLADIDRTSAKRVGHVPFPATVDRLHENLFTADVGK